MTQMRFNQARRAAVRLANEFAEQAGVSVSLVRDVHGRILFLLPSESETGGYKESITRLRAELARELGQFAAPNVVLLDDQLYSPSVILNDPAWQEILSDTESTQTIKILERQAVGEDWALEKFKEDENPHPPRVVFFSIKGGVGRSSALVFLAQQLAADGKKVLVVDFDLESPGLSSMLLSSDQLPDIGAVDWLVEMATGDAPQADAVVQYSPLSDLVAGRVRVAVAAGADDDEYLAKLGRIYSDNAGPSGPKRFADRLLLLIQKLEESEQPDVTLIDSRGGLHDIAAVSLSRLADLGLLFCTDSDQSWEGYRHLFEYWRQRPSALRSVRERLKMVYALSPDSAATPHLSAFRQKSWNLFSTTLYDEVAAGTDETQQELFSFAEGDTDSPHSPLVIRWNPVFRSFDLRITPEQGGISDADIKANYGEFVAGVRTLIGDNDD